MYNIHTYIVHIYIYETITSIKDMVEESPRFHKKVDTEKKTHSIFSLNIEFIHIMELH